MADLFRKAALDKVSSPDQLDKQIKLISPSFWIAVTGAGLIIAVALIWSIFGRLPVNVAAGGMYMGEGGVYSVIAEADGIVKEVFVSDGDSIGKGQEVAQLDSSVYDEEIASLQRRITDVESVTFWSAGDPATADTKSLLDIKSQVDVAGSSLSADQIALRERYKALSEQKTATADAKSKRNSAKKKCEELNDRYVNYHYEDKMTAAVAKLEAAKEKLRKYKEEHPDYDPEDPEYKALEKAEADALKAKQDLETDYQTLQIDMKNAESEYSLAQQNYSSELSKQKSLEDTVSQMEAKVRADRSTEGNQVSSYEKQFDAAKGSILDQLGKELEKQQKSADKTKLKSRVNGRVSGLSIAKGNVVQTGMTICRVTSEGDDEIVILYVPVSEGKKIKSGMDVVVYPSTVNRQEFGHMEGKVIKVSNSVVSSEEMLNQLGDQSLVQAYQQTGPVIRVTCSLEKDENTASGYKWSSKKGAEVSIDEGTVVTADIITEEKAPITMLIPFLKEKLTVKSKDDPQTSQSSGGQEAGK